jgi:hypothetical protein
MSKDMVIKQLTLECDRLAARHWELGTMDRSRSYLEWLQKVKQTADIIDKNRPNDFYFLRGAKKDNKNNGL